MCESVERYADQKAIKTLIEASAEWGADKAEVIEVIKKRFALSQDQAETLYERYAPALV